MIPDVDPVTGNLPPGIHAASWEEVVERYGYTDHRRQLLDGLALALQALRRAGCRRVYLDGSFVSAKGAPGDYDVCWDPADVDLPRLGLFEPLLFDVEPPRRRQKAAFGGEFLPTTVTAGSPGGTILDLFQHDKETGRPKGIILLDPGDGP
jgi:hypothetical protein